MKISCVFLISAFASIRGAQSLATPSNPKSATLPFFASPISSTTTTATNSPPPLVEKKRLRPTYNKEEIRVLQRQAEELARDRHDNNAWNALFVSVLEQPDPTPLSPLGVEGVLPTDFPPGALLRLGPNAGSPDDGFFDADGMIQCVTFPPQQAAEKEQQQPQTMTATYVDTRGRQLERKFQKKFKGSLGGVPKAWPMLQSLIYNGLTFQTIQVQKDTCNTALAEHGGRILALMEQSPPTEIQIHKDGSISTLQSNTLLDGAIDFAPISGGALSAHGRTCPWTNDRIHVSYRADQAPYLRVDIFAPGWQLKERMEIDIPTPIFLHDCAITQNYVVIFDFPLTVKTSRLLRNEFPVNYEPHLPARIGLVPRGESNNNKETLWFDVEPGVLLHASNAWESADGKTVTIQGLRGVPEGTKSYLEATPGSYLYEYEIDLESGKVVVEQCLNPNVILEFPAIHDERYTGRPNPAVYGIAVRSFGGPLFLYKQPQEGLMFDRVVKMAAIESGENFKGDVLSEYVLPERWYLVSEPTVVGKQGTKGEENGEEYVLAIATHVPEGVSWKQVKETLEGTGSISASSPLQSKVMVLDGKDLNAGPVYSAILPFHVPYGLHSSFIPWDTMV